MTTGEPHEGRVAIGIIVTDRGPRVLMDINGETRLIGPLAASTIAHGLLRAAALCDGAQRIENLLAGRDADLDLGAALLDELITMREPYEDDGTMVGPGALPQESGEVMWV